MSTSDSTYSDEHYTTHMLGNVEMALVEQWKKSGEDFTTLQTAIEIDTFRPRLFQVEWSLASRAGLKRSEFSRYAGFLTGVEKKINEHHGINLNHHASPYVSLIGLSSCDMYRILDAAKALSDEDAGFFAYFMAVGRFSSHGYTKDFDEATKERDRRHFSFLPERIVRKNYKARRGLSAPVYEEYVEEDDLIMLRDEIIQKVADVVKETVILTVIEQYAQVKVIEGWVTGDTTAKRTYEGGSMAESVAFSECALNETGLRVVGSGLADTTTKVLEVTNELSNREVRLTEPVGGIKIKISKGETAHLTDSDLQKTWTVTSVPTEQEDSENA